MKSFAVLALALAAQAFAPSARTAGRTSAVVASFPRRRAVEVKHGRISMMAFIGMLVQELGVTFPGAINLDGSVQFADIGTGFGALSKIPPFGIAQILIFGALAELVAMPSSQYTGGPQNLPAGFDGSAGTIPGGYPFTTQITDPAARTRALNCEIQNGRGAMLGVFGCMCHSMLDSTDHHFFYPISPGYPFTTQ